MILRAKKKNLGFLGADNKIFTMADVEKEPVKTISSKAAKKSGGYYDNRSIITKNEVKPIKKENKATSDIRTIKLDETPNSEGYTKTNQKYGSYKYQDYDTKKDYDIYKKDDKSYYYDPKAKTYIDMDMPTMTSAKEDKKQYKEAVKQGYKGKKVYEGIDYKKQVAPTKIADQVELETSGLTKKEKEKYTKSLIRQEKKAGRDLNYVREGSTLGEIKNMAKNVNEKAVEPISRAPSSYDYGKLSQDLSLAYYDKMMGKKSNIKEIQRKIDNYNKFNKDIVNSNNMLDTHFKNMPNEIGGMVAGIKNAGPLGAIGAVAGGALGAAGTKTATGTVVGAEKGAKLLGGAGYVKGQAENTYKLEAGATYQTLLDMGVPDKIAKKEAKKAGTENAIIESGESILDLLTMGKASAATGALKKGIINKLIGEYGEKAVKSWGLSYVTNIASEGAQEVAQESRSIAAEKRAAKQAGIKRDDSQDNERLLEAGKGGAFSAALSGAATRIAGMTGSTAYKTARETAMNKVLSLNDTERAALTEVTQKVKRGEPLNEQDRAVIGVINNKPSQTEATQQTIEPTTVAEPTQTVRNKASQAETIQTVPITQETPKTVQKTVETPKQETTESISDPEQVRKESKTRVVKYSQGENKGRMYKNIPYDDKSYGMMSDEDLKVASDIALKRRRGEELTKGEQQTLDYLKRKKAGRKNPELTQIKSFEEIRPEYGKYYAKADMDKFDSTIAEKSAETIPANRYGRTKQQWYDLAKNIGLQADKMDSESLKKYAYESYKYFNPNQSINKQGNKKNYTQIHEWINAVYEGAGVGKKTVSDNSQNIAATKTDNVIKATTPKEVVNNFDKAKTGKLDGKQLRSWVETSNEATGNQDLIDKADVDKITYETKTNKKTYEEAKNNTKNLKYEEKVFRAEDKLNSSKKITATDLAEAQMALLEAAKAGNVNDYLNLQQDIAIMGTELGQAVQSLSMIQKMSPDGQIAMLNKIVNRQQKSGNKSFDGVKIKEKLVQKVLDSYDDDTHTTFNKEKMDNAVNDLKQDIADQMKVSVGEKINNWRYLSMLGNPKTHIRNIVANIAMSIVKGTKDTISAATQDVASTVGLMDKSQKTTTLKKASKDVKSLANIAYEETFAASKGNKYNERSELENLKQVFNNKVLEKVRKGNEKLLDVEDQAFKNYNFKKSFAKYLTAQGITTAEQINANPQIVADAKAFAVQEAKIATFQQENNLAKWINKADNLGTAGKVIRGAIIPFTRTPLNIAKTGMEYTPGLGITTLVSDVKKAPDNMKGAVWIDGISKQVTGASLALLGYALAKSGKVTADEGDDKEAQFEKDQGAKMGYSIKLFGKSYDLSWLSPSSMPFFVGARMHEVLDKQEKINPDIIVESLASTLDPLSEMSCISSFTKVLKSFNSGSMGMIKDMGETTLQNYISQFIPTVSSQFARWFDPNQRDTQADKTSGSKLMQETGRQLAYKIPGLRNMLPERTDYYGDTKKDTKNFWLRGIESLLSPANTRTDKLSKQSKELIRLYKKTGNDDILPSALQKYINFNDKKYDMSQREYNKYKKEFGKAFKDNLKELMDSTDYKDASDDEKAEMVQGIMKYSKDKTKNIFLTNKGEDYTKTTKNGETTYYESDKVDDIIGDNYSIADYYIFKTNAPEVVSGNTENQKKKLAFTNVFDINPEDYSEYLEGIGNIKADYNSKGKAIRNSRKRKIVDYLNSFDFTPNQKAALLKQNYSSYKQYDKAIYNYINDSDLTVEEKNSLASFLKIK